MLSYHLLKQHPRVLRAFTSLDPDEFELLLIPFQQAWEAYVTRYYIEKKSRKRRYGGGRKPTLSAIEDKLLFILFYFKVYPLGCNSYIDVRLLPDDHLTQSELFNLMESAC